MTTVGFIGTGTMASSIVTGMTRSTDNTDERHDRYDILVYDIHPERAEALAATAPNVNVAASAIDLANRADLVILAVKPYAIADAVTDIASSVAQRGAALVSIAAGITLSALAELAAPDTPIVRIMPNVNAIIGAAMSALAGNEHVTLEQRATAISIFERIGNVIELDEKHFSAFTAIAGSSPAFTFVYIDALARAAVKAGMPKNVATQVAAQAVLGSAKLVQETGKHPWELADMVSSPGGTTVAGLLEMEDRGFFAAVVAGVTATINRDKELGSS